MNLGKKALKDVLLAALLLTGTSPALYSQTAVWPEVKKEMKPWTRWWWMGNAVNEKDLEASLQFFHKAGLGGVEIAPIYGVHGYESQEINFLSPRWMEMLRTTVNSAQSLGMGVDLTNGTGWPFGGPHITAPYAASKLIVQQYKLAAGQVLSQKIKVNDPKQEAASLQFISAYNENGDVIQLGEKVSADGTLNWSPEKGNWELYAVFNGKTRQMVKRSSPGGEGYTLNHFSREAVNVYLSRFDSVFSRQAPGVRAFYNDSYEVYGANWSEEFLRFFQEKRGYDLRVHIREFLAKEPSDLQARLKSDYRETMSDMLLQNFTQPWTAWSRSYKGLTRNQAHGSPGNLLDLYAAVDIPEVETFGSSYFPIPGLRRDSADVRNVDPDPVMLKFASSAAHVAGHNLVSCETFTWLTEHFKTSLSQCKPEVEQAFLSGINHVFFHGTTYSPAEAPWPGWLFYASVNFVPTNSFWSHLPGLNSYITRVQSVLQTGKPDNELLMYWPVYDAWNKSKGMDMPFKVHDIDEWLHPAPFYKDVTDLQNAGYSLDFVSDKLLKNAVVVNGEIVASPGAAPYRALVVPQAELMPLATLEKMLELASKGATLVVQSLPKDVPGASKLQERRARLKELLNSLRFSPASEGTQTASYGAGRIVLSPDVQKGVATQLGSGEQLVQTGLKFIRRKDGNNVYYYLVNHTPKDIDSFVPLLAKGSSALIMDPQNGRYGYAEVQQRGGALQARLQIRSGEALILKVSGTPSAAGGKWVYLSKGLPAISLNGKWNLKFTEGGPSLPAGRALERLAPWTGIAPDADLAAFSGSAVYSTSFKLDKLDADDYLLNLGKVYESARVWVNGQDAGILWSIPYKARIGHLLRKGKNEIRVEVSNLMANRIRHLDKNGVKWKYFKDINVVDINYKPFNASGWQVMPSGLEGPVTITPYRK